MTAPTLEELRAKVLAALEPFGDLETDGPDEVALYQRECAYHFNFEGGTAHWWVVHREPRRFIIPKVDALTAGNIDAVIAMARASAKEAPNG